jgi:hypothetical protein
MSQSYLFMIYTVICDALSGLGFIVYSIGWVVSNEVEVIWKEVGTLILNAVFLFVRNV